MQQYGSSTPEPFGNDPWLEPYKDVIAARLQKIAAKCRELCGSFSASALAKWAQAHKKMGLHRTADGFWNYCDWAPNAVGA